MSTYGSYRLQLKRQRQAELRRRREQERKQRVRQEAARLIAEGRQTGRQVSNNLTRHFSQEAQQESEAIVQQAEQLLQSDPDKALKLARKSRASAERGMAQASGQAAEWTKEKVAAKEAVTVFELSLQSMLNDSDADDNKELAVVANQLAEAKTALRRENFADAKKAAVAGHKKVQEIEQTRQQQQQKENERREIVRGLRQVLTGMGFAVKDPVLGKDRQEGKVVLVGELPSGRTARFAISLDGRLNYDFDGYDDYESEGGCGTARDQVCQRLQEQIYAKASDHEMHWKGPGPERLEKDKKQLPTNKQRGMSA